MIISDDKRIREIQREFNQKFPFLKLEFYKGHHQTGEGSPVETQLPQEQVLGDVRTVHQDGDFEVRKDLTVAELEQSFFDQFGLNVQVFRKSGNLWMQTTSTDHWTLEQQNRKGGASESAYKEKYNQ